MVLYLIYSNYEKEMLPQKGNFPKNKLKGEKTWIGLKFMNLILSLKTKCQRVHASVQVVAVVAAQQ